MKATLQLATKYEWSGREFGPGEVEFDLTDEGDRSAHDYLSRVVETAVETAVRAPKGSASPKAKRGQRPKRQADSEQPGGDASGA